MSTLLGWFELPLAEGASEAVVAMMARARAFAGVEAPRASTGPALALAVAGPSGEADLAEEGSISAAITGRPRWEHPELAALAAQRGHAAALIEAYRRDGEGLFRHLRGAFSLAIIARAANRVLLAIDRFGIGTLCYGEARSGLVFGSSTDVVGAHPALSSTVAPQAIFDYLYLGVSPSPRTIYREQSKLLPAQYAVFENGRLRTAFHWRVPYGAERGKSVASLADELMRRLRTAVDRVIEGTDPSTLGAFLSGGLDSSTVAGLLSQASAGRVKTFTIGFSHDQYDEVGYAEIAARHFGTEQHNYYLTPQDVAAVLGDVSRAFDEPFGNSSVVPAYFCAKVAKETGVRLMLAGDGGDEIFAGNSRYVDQKIFEFYGRLPAALRRSLIEPLVLAAPGVDRWSLGRRARNYVRRAMIPLPDRLEANNFYRTAGLYEVFESDCLAAIDPAAPLANLREAYGRTASEATLHKMLHLDLKITLADNDLRKVGTACAMAGVSVAYPFLDDDVVEFSAQIPPDRLIRGLDRRWFFRRAVRNFLAPETLAKRKHGFGMPFAEWPRENAELREIAADCLGGFRRRHYLRGDFLDRLLEGGAVLGSLVWDVMMLELWFRARETSRRDDASRRVVA